MITTTISEFRKRIKHYLDDVTRNFETLIISRGKDNGVVVMSLEEYNALKTTQHELTSKANEKRLDAAVENSGKANPLKKICLMNEVCFC